MDAVSMSSRFLFLAVLLSEIHAADSPYAAWDLMIPSQSGEEVLPSLEPPRARGFQDKYGKNWVIYWDHKLETPRLVSPRL